MKTARGQRLAFRTVSGQASMSGGLRTGNPGLIKEAKATRSQAASVLASRVREWKMLVLAFT